MHRNIKPANLIVKSDAPSDMAITDLGCATVENEILYDRPGNIPYLALEQREGLKHGENVDIWALGVVGLELFGRLRPQAQIDLRGSPKLT
jgi:serine/threonine protein kinase